MIRLDVNIADEELIEYEKRYISKYNSKFNFTECGDGFGSGKNNPNFGKLGKDNPFYKEYARVIKGGFKNYAFLLFCQCIGFLYDSDMFHYNLK